MGFQRRLALAVLAWTGYLAHIATAKAVFAHFMVGNTVGWGVSDWQQDIVFAQTAKIDAFALNIAHGEAVNDAQIRNAFQAANDKGFKLFFSFDYAGGDGDKTGGWPKEEVRGLLRQYANNGAYYKRGGQPFVSTFEGPNSAGDWSSIKSEFGVFFVPDWSSLGAKDALNKAPGVPDGLFNWGAWPWGYRTSDTYTDASYLNFLGGPDAGRAKYMMPVSPWFYTNMPGFTKNWMWNGHDLWHDRWQQVLNVQPEFVQIISWNDFGESHYIGPMRNSPPFKDGKAKFDYVTGQTHDGWRLTLPYYIDLYKAGTTTVAMESVIAWYTLHLASSCDIADTTLNTATQLQQEFEPPAGRTIFFSAVLASPANVSISVGGNTRPSPWTKEPYGGVGVYHGSFPASDFSGDVVITLKRGNDVLATLHGAPVGGCGPGGFANFNPWVGSALSTKAIAPKSPPLNVADMVCVDGTGLGKFQGLCEFNCKYTNCPVTACVCTKLGPKPTIPPWKNTPGYTTGDPNFIGLCNYACNLGYCPNDVCSRTEMPIVNPPVSPFFPDTCTAGTSRSGEDGAVALAPLCQFTCQYGYCPLRRCTCTRTGVLRVPPPENAAVVGLPDFRLRLDVAVNPICDFACRRGYCPPGACILGTALSVKNGPLCTPNTPKDDWKCLSCKTSSSILSQDASSLEQWNQSKAWDSILEFRKWYPANVDMMNAARQWFTMAIALFYSYTDGDFTCGQADTVGCRSTVDCDSGIDMPVAGATVLRSLVQMNIFFDAWESGLQNAANNASLYTEKFIETFSPKIPEDLGDKFANWLASTIVSLTLGGAFKGFNKLSGGKMGDGEAVWDAVSEWVTGKLDDALEESITHNETATEGDIKEEIGAILYAQKVASHNFVQDMFNGSSEADHNALTDALRNGIWLKARGLDKFQLEEKAMLYLYNLLIPHFWMQRGDSAPVIIVSDVDRNSTNPFAKRWPQDQSLNDQEAARARLWGIDGKTFWLVAARRCDHFVKEPYGPYFQCAQDVRFREVFGVEQLNGSLWSGVNMADMIVSAWNGYKKNGYKNGYDLSADPQGQRFNADGTNFLFGEGARMPGLNQIPICDYDLANHNALWFQQYGNAKKPCDEYPCCRDLKID